MKSKLQNVGLRGCGAGWGLKISGRVGWMVWIDRLDPNIYMRA